MVFVIRLLSQPYKMFDNLELNVTELRASARTATNQSSLTFIRIASNESAACTHFGC